MASGDRFYLLEFGSRPALWGDVGSLLRINGLVVGCGEANAVLMLPGLRDSFTDNPGVVLEPTIQEWSDFIQYSDDPLVYVQEGNAKVFHRKLRYAISGAVQQKIWRADEFQCVYCGAKMGDTLLTIDHFVPLELGGVNNQTNFVSACRACNKKKGDSTPEQWMATVHRWLGTPEEKVATVKKYLRERKV
jgi:hypothetical protein